MNEEQKSFLRILDETDLIILVTKSQRIGLDSKLQGDIFKALTEYYSKEKKDDIEPIRVDVNERDDGKR